MADPPNERRGHQYRENTVTDNARVHNGDQYHRYERVEAVYHGDVARASTPVSRGSVLSLTRRITESKNGEALIDAASKGQIERMNRILSEKYTNIDFMNRNKTTALLAAIEYGQLAAVTTLLKRGADPGLRDSRRHKTHLVLAAEMGRLDIFSVLLHHGAPMDGLSLGRERDIKEEWWDLKLKDRRWVYQFDKELYCRYRDDGITDTLAIAISHSKPAIIIELLKHGLQPHKEALVTAIVLNDAEVVQSLVSAGADAEIFHREFGYNNDWRPLHLAAYAGLVNSVQGLITARADVEAQSAFWGTPIHCAAWGNHEEAVRTLLTAGASIEARDLDGHTPLMIAVQANSSEALQVLLAAGADRDARGDREPTAPLHLAAYDNAEKYIENLLAAGADIEARGRSGSTPLHCAAFWLSMNGVQTLLAAGAHVSVLDGEGKTPYDVALAQGPESWHRNGGKDKEKILALLKQHMEHDDFDSRSFITARTTQNLEADETATIRPDSDDEDNDEDAVFRT